MTSDSTGTNLQKSAGRSPEPTDQPGAFALDTERRTIGGAARGYINRLRSGDPGALPSVFGLIVLAIIFSQVSDRFLTKNNVGFLPGQGAYIAVIALGLIFVLLLGEIDLSAGTTGGMCAAFAVQGIFSHGLRHGTPGLLYWSVLGFMVLSIVIGVWMKSITGPIIVAIGIIFSLTSLDQHVILALIFAVAVGCAVGIITGFLVAAVGVPSFIVTLALFLAWQGVLLFALNSQPVSINSYQFWYGLAHNNMSPLWSWVFAIVLVVGYFGYTAIRSWRAHLKGLAADTFQLVMFRAVILAIVAFLITFFANQNRNTNTFAKIDGLPWAAVIPIGLMIICTIALNDTPWGRHLFATGGNQEAARRAGIDVRHIKVSAFTVNGGFAALGGVFLASTTGGVQLDLGNGNILLFSVAAAVIGGTSLFGGRGKPRDAIIGALVIVIIPNGLGLKPSLPVQYQYVVTGVVLLVAAAVDALTRRRSVRT